MKKHPKFETRRQSESFKIQSNMLDLINEHEVIRETVGYNFLKDIELYDIPEVIQFLKVVYNYKKINLLNKQDNK